MEMSLRLAGFLWLLEITSYYYLYSKEKNQFVGKPTRTD